MKKALLTKLMLLLCALIAGSSSVWADTEVVFTLNDPDAISALGITLPDAGKGTKVEEIQKDGVTIAATTADGKTDTRIYQGSGGNAGKYDFRIYQDGTLTFSAGNLFVKKIVFTGKSLDKLSGTGYSTDTWTGSKASVTLTATATVTIYTITVTIGAANKVATPDISGELNFLESTDVTITCGTDGAAIQYSTDGTNWSAYSAPFTLTETTTVYAKATKNGMTDSDQASKTFTKATIMTVAQARAAIDAGAGTTGVYATGTVSEIVTAYNAQYSNITFNMSEDGLTTSDQLQAYRCGGAEAANIGVGDVVVISGNLTKYGETYEFAQGCQIVSRTPAAVPVPVITASNVTIEADATSGEIAYTVENPTGATLSAELTDGNWISNVAVAGNKVTFTATANTGDERTATITLSYTGASNKVVTVTQKKYVPAAALPFAFIGGRDAIEGVDGLSQTGLGSDYNSSPLLKFDGNNDELVLKISDAASVLNFDIKGNGNPWAGTFKVQTSEDGITYTDLQTYNDLASTVSHQSLALASTVRYIKWIYITKTSGNVAIGRIGVDCEPVTVPADGYATVCFPSKIDFAGTTGVKAYRVSEIVANYVELAEIESAPANTPVILEASEGFYKLNLTASPAAVGTNLLLASDGTATTDNDYTVYALATKGDITAVTGFYKVKAGVKVPAGKCYLSVAATPAPEFLGFGDATGIENVNRETITNNRYFNLNGQRVAQPTKGLYIVNGKKVIIK